MKILHLGDGASPFMTSLLSKFHEHGDRGDLISYYPASRPPSIRRFRSFERTGGGSWQEYKNMLRACHLALLSAFRRYDLVLVNYVSPLSLPFFVLHSLARPTVAVVWGSDYNAKRSISRWCFRWSLKLAARVLFLIPETRTECINQSLVTARNSSVVRFGLPILRIIRAEGEEIGGPEARAQFGLPLDRKIVVVGSNSRISQNHFEIIEVLKRNAADLGGFFFVFPLGYGDPEYASKVEEKALELGVENIKCLRGFYRGTELARLRMACDVFINLQSHDQLSATMVEYLYAGAEVITGAWLPYSTLIDGGIPLSLIEDFAELIDRLRRTGLDRGSRQLPTVRKILDGMYDPDAAFAGWISELRT
jgi:glycosyltransferase involved in cell wall biosynthesis